MKLNLTRPLVFFDLETTGIDVANDRIVEISYHKIFPNGREETKSFRVKPEIPIPPAATEIHGISNEDVANCPTFKEIAKELERAFEGCDIAGYNSNRFDVPLLAEEFLRVDNFIDLKKRKFIDVQTIFHKMEQRTLSAAYQFYCNKNLDNAHSAEVDTLATAEVLFAQLDRYSELENNVDFLSKFTEQNAFADFAGRIIYNEKGEETFNFGKYKGQTVEEVLRKDTGYFGWVLESNFPLYTKRVLTNIKLRDFNKK